jgi:glycerol-3-phosphate acyltransferase PlsY
MYAEHKSMVIILLIGSYLIGSIPFAYLIVRWLKNIDIRRVGSLNPGAANVISQVGKGVGALVVLLDFGKGLLPVFIATSLGFPLWVAGLSGILAVVGHCWPLYMRFDGGEGMMPAMGVLGALAPKEFAFALLGAIIGGYIAKYFDLQGWFSSRINTGAVVGFVAFYFLLIHWRRPLILITIVIILTVVLIIRQVQVSKTHLQDF